MDFLAKIKELLGGLGGGGAAPAGAGAGAAAPPGNPWDVPINGGPQMPMAQATPPPTAPPQSSIEDAVQQAVNLQKQREKVKMLAPDWLNAP